LVDSTEETGTVDLVSTGGPKPSALQAHHRVDVVPFKRDKKLELSYHGCLRRIGIPTGTRGSRRSESIFHLGSQFCRRAALILKVFKGRYYRL